ncbi:MAG: O-antigen ligase family protein [Bacteroidota bacterium]
MSTEKLKRGLVNKILLSFVISCFLATLLSILHIYYLHFYTEIPLPSLTVESFYRDNFTSLLDIHPTYYSMYITFSTIVIVFFLFRDWNKLKIYVKFLALFVIVYFAFINILLSSRMLLLISLLMLVTLLIRFLFKNRVAGIIIILFLTLSTTFFFIHKNNIIKKRFTELTETQWTPPIGIYYNSTNLRVGILNCSFSLLKNNWLFGFGTGSAQKNLNACYQSSGYSDVLFIDQYDTHNQYLNVWLNTGVIGLAIFLLTIVIPMKKAYKANCFLYLAFLSLIALCCFTESLLERQSGIVFYAFFNSLFSFHVIEKSNMGIQFLVSERSR